MLKIADFIGDEYGLALRTDETRLENVLKNISVKAMKEGVNEGLKSIFQEVDCMFGGNIPRWLELLKESIGPEAWGKPMTGDFVRKGVVGDWRHHFSEDQVKRLQRRIEEKTRGTDVMSLWKDADIPHTGN